MTKPYCWLACCLVVASFAVVPEGAQAGGIAFRNELQTPIVVQGSSIINNMIRRGQPIVILPNRLGLDANLIPKLERHITIYDASQPNRLLFRDVIPYNGGDLLFAVQPNPAGPMPVRLFPLAAGN